MKYVVELLAVDHKWLGLGPWLTHCAAFCAAPRALNRVVHQPCGAACAGIETQNKMQNAKCKMQNAKWHTWHWQNKSLVLLALNCIWWSIPYAMIQINKKPTKHSSHFMSDITSAIWSNFCLISVSNFCIYCDCIFALTIMAMAYKHKCRMRLSKYNQTLYLIIGNG